MTFVVATSDEEIVDVTPRYVKDWCIVKERRSDIMENTLKAVIRNYNNNLYNKLSDEEKNKLNERRIKEKEEFESKTGECKVSEEKKSTKDSEKIINNKKWRTKSKKNESLINLIHQYNNNNKEINKSNNE